MPKTEGTFNNGRRSLTREHFGTDTIDGLSVIGTRETVTTSTGVEGKSQPVVSSEESWYSPDLEVNLIVTRKDPLQGTIVIHVARFVAGRGGCIIVPSAGKLRCGRSPAVSLRAV
jgi:hypothetical protein